MSASKNKSPLQRTELLNQLWHFQNKNGFIRNVDIAEIADNLGLSKIEVEHINHPHCPDYYSDWSRFNPLLRVRRHDENP